MGAAIDNIHLGLPKYRRIYIADRLAVEHWFIPEQIQPKIDIIRPGLIVDITDRVDKKVDLHPSGFTYIASRLRIRRRTRGRLDCWCSRRRGLCCRHGDGLWRNEGL